MGIVYIQKIQKYKIQNTKYKNANDNEAFLPLIFHFSTTQFDPIVNIQNTKMPMTTKHFFHLSFTFPPHNLIPLSIYKDTKIQNTKYKIQNTKMPMATKHFFHLSFTFSPHNLIPLSIYKDTKIQNTKYKIQNTK